MHLISLGFYRRLGFLQGSWVGNKTVLFAITRTVRTNGMLLIHPTNIPDRRQTEKQLTVETEWNLHLKS